MKTPEFYTVAAPAPGAPVVTVQLLRELQAYLETAAAAACEGLGEEDDAPEVSGLLGRVTFVLARAEGLR